MKNGANLAKLFEEFWQNVFLIKIHHFSAWYSMRKIGFIAPLHRNLRPRPDHASRPGCGLPLSRGQGTGGTSWTPWTGTPPAKQKTTPPKFVTCELRTAAGCSIIGPWKWFLFKKDILVKMKCESLGRHGSVGKNRRVGDEFERCDRHDRG